MHRSCRRLSLFAAVIPSCVIEAFLDRVQQINQAEVFADVIALTSLGERLKGIDLIHFVDNLSALAGFIGGTATQEDSAAIFAIFDVLLVHFYVRSWAEHVESLANIADGPSRNGDQDPTSRLMGCQFLKPVIPEFLNAAAQPYHLILKLARGE